MARIKGFSTYGEYVRIAVTDTGPGLRQSDLARIFTGFATKEYGERSVLIERSQPSGCACASKHRAAPAAEAGVAV